MRICDWSSDVCSSDLLAKVAAGVAASVSRLIPIAAALDVTLATDFLADLDPVLLQPLARRLLSVRTKRLLNRGEVLGRNDLAALGLGDDRRSLIFRHAALRLLCRPASADLRQRARIAGVDQ